MLKLECFPYLKKYVLSWGHHRSSLSHVCIDSVIKVLAITTVGRDNPVTWGFLLVEKAFHDLFHSTTVRWGELTRKVIY
jgi:hypothetical protein